MGGGSSCRRAVAEAAQRSKAENEPRFADPGAGVQRVARKKDWQLCSGREESDGSLFRRWVLFFLSFANAGTGRILLPTPCNRRCRWIQEFCYHCMRGLVAQGSYILKLGIITSYPLSPTFYKAYVPANSSPKSSSGPQAQILCGCGLCVLAVIVISAHGAQPLLQPRTALPYLHLDVGCIF